MFGVLKGASCRMDPAQKGHWMSHICGTCFALQDQAFEYFTRAWGEVVFPRLKYRFEYGPMDWDNPPSFEQTT